MVRKFKTDLSDSGIDNLISELNKYKEVTLQNATELFVSRLADIGIWVAQNSVGELGAFITFQKKVDKSMYGCTGLMMGINSTPNVSVYYNKEGEQRVEISSILMAEFGSGVHADSTMNIEQRGHRGTFPNQTHAFQPYWYYATRLDEKGNPTGWVKTDGIEPTAPMYRASMAMQREIEATAYNVFN